MLTWILAGVTIVLTTSKGVILAFIVVSLFLTFRKLVSKKVWIAFSFAIALLVILLPLYSSLENLIPYSNIETERILFDSMYMRTTSNWPETLDFIQKNGSVIFGRGVGGIGSANMYFENVNYPGDNLFVFLYSTIGISSVLVIFFFPLLSRSLNFKNSNFDCFLFSVTLALLSYGLVSSIFEEITFTLFIGIVLSRLFHGMRFVGVKSSFEHTKRPFA